MTEPSTAELWITGFAALAGAGSATAAFLSWRSSKSNTKIADTVARIERDRWHRELKPSVRIVLTVKDKEANWVQLDVHLDGPVGLDRLDALAVRIRDDFPGRATVTPPPPTQEEIDNTIWGPLRFKKDVEGVDRRGRASHAHPLDVGECLVFALTKTLNPYWSSATSWQSDYHDFSQRWLLRLTVTCEKAGFKPWHFPADIEFDPSIRQVPTVVSLS